MKQIPLFEAKNRLSAVVHEVETGGPMTLTRHGRPVAVLVDSDSFERLAARERLFGSLLDRFLHDWPPTAEVDDPFEGIRSAEGGRRVVL